MIGVKKTGDLLSNLTWGLIIVLFALTISTNFITIERAQATDEFIDRAQEESTVPSLDLGDVESSEESTPVDQNDGLQNLESEEDSE